MKYKKLLFTILVIILVMLTLMLATSYAWYSFNTGSTTFNAVTNNSDVSIDFVKGDYINNNAAIPISSSEIDEYSDKYQFIVKTTNNPKDNDILLNVSLVDISIDNPLRVSDFKVELYYQGSLISTVTGNQLMISGATTKLLSTVTLNNNIDNNFEVRVYLLDNGSDQSSLMNLNFSAKIQTEVVSKLKVNGKVSDYSDADIQVTSITVDGENSKSIPTDGYYTMRSTCTKGSSLTWDGYSKTITYGNGSKVGDSCSLVFTSATSNKLLNTVEVGSYVQYTGNNGCSGKACEGQNANYVDDNDMGYCNANNQGFIVNGWRVAYIKDGSAYLISAGSPECMCTSKDGTAGTSCSDHEETNGVPQHLANLNAKALTYCNSTYSYNNVCNSSSSWNMNTDDFQSITGDSLSTAFNKISGYYNRYSLINNGGYYWFATPYSSSSTRTFVWGSHDRSVNYSIDSRYANGLRPVLRLRSSVVVVSGRGTYKDPYVIQ